MQPAKAPCRIRSDRARENLSKLAVIPRRLNNQRRSHPMTSTFTRRTAWGLLATALLALPAHASARPDSNIVEVVVAANAPGGAYEGQFDTLIAAILVADPVVLSTLSGVGQFTVFGPTDDAFAAAGLDETNVGTLGQDTLSEVLLYHVSPGRRDSTAVLGATRLRMLSGGFLRQSAGVLTDNLGRNANIILTDVRTSNGIIHAIDAVVLPRAL
jgi:uncharacterized surface protein with fasciclin (FAS1) repeats